MRKALPKDLAILAASAPVRPQGLENVDEPKTLRFSAGPAFPTETPRLRDDNPEPWRKNGGLTYNKHPRKKR